MNTNETLNFNYSDIWKSQWNVGSTRYINVIDGTERVVPWGHYEWIGAAWGAVFSATSMAFLGYLIYFGLKKLALI